MKLWWLEKLALSSHDINDEIVHTVTFRMNWKAQGYELNNFWLRYMIGFMICTTSISKCFHLKIYIQDPQL
jgi:hypothetical protein